MDGSERTYQRVTEADFTQAVIELATYRRWKVTHFRPARTMRGWATPVQGDPGFPDLVLARRGDVIFAELKTEKGRVTQAQAAWATALGSQYRLWRPSQMDDIARELM